LRHVLVLDPAAQGLLFRVPRTANTFTEEPVNDEPIQAIYDRGKYGRPSTRARRASP
jgi:3-hydroxypropanoate dehydrogenase